MLEIPQVAPKEVLHARNSLTGLTARILAYPPVPTTLSGVTPGAEFPEPDSAARTLGDLVRLGTLGSWCSWIASALPALTTAA